MKAAIYEYLTTDQCKQVLLCLAEYNKCVIILTGGEPMEREDIYELIKYGNNVGHRMTVATCGYCQTTKFQIRFLMLLKEESEIMKMVRLNFYFRNKSRDM